MGCTRARLLFPYQFKIQSERVNFSKVIYFDTEKFCFLLINLFSSISQQISDFNTATKSHVNVDSTVYLTF